MEEFSMSSCSKAYAFKASKWLETIAVQCLLSKYLTIALASASPSRGLVPVPTSSSKTRSFPPTIRKIDAMFAICPEKVERLS